MLLEGIKRGIGCTLALVILLSALVGYLPTSNCHCRDTKTPKSQKVQCPFGQLRNLSITLTAASTLDFATISTEVPVAALFSYKKLEGSSLLLAFDAQAPPFLL
jgi:hypothetical protein